MAILPGPSGGLPPMPTTQPAYMQNPNYSALNPQYTSTPAPATNPFGNKDYNNMIQSSLDYFMNPNSQYIQSARQAGMQVAAERGGVNSSIAAGASEKAALDAAQGLALGSVQSQNARDSAVLNDWMDQQSFNRNLQAMPFQNSMQMLGWLTQASIQDPSIYTPSAVSGMSNFFTQNMNDIMKQYFKP